MYNSVSDSKKKFTNSSQILISKLSLQNIIPVFCSYKCDVVLQSHLHIFTLYYPAFSYILFQCILKLFDLFTFQIARNTSSAAAFVSFSRSADARRALQRDGQFIGGYKVSIQKVGFLKIYLLNSERFQRIYFQCFK